MSVERWDGHAWLTCDADCGAETQPVPGDRTEAVEQAVRERWVRTASGWLCPACAPPDETV